MTTPATSSAPWCNQCCTYHEGAGCPSYWEPGPVAKIPVRFLGDMHRRIDELQEQMRGASVPLPTPSATDLMRDEYRVAMKAANAAAYGEWAIGNNAAVYRGALRRGIAAFLASRGVRGEQSPEGPYTLEGPDSDGYFDVMWDGSPAFASKSEVKARAVRDALNRVHAE
jgi:hypothetical protein